MGGGALVTCPVGDRAGDLSGGSGVRGEGREIAGDLSGFAGQLSDTEPAWPDRTPVRPRGAPVETEPSTTRNGLTHGQSRNNGLPHQ